MTTQVGTRRRIAALVTAFGLVLAACGDDDGDAGGSPATTEAADDATTTTGGDSGEGEFAEYCAAAEELDQQDDFASAEQIQNLVDLAPEEIAEPASIAGPPLIAAADDPVATFAAFAADDVEEAIAEINAFETEHCGIEHDEPPVGPNEPEAGATAVDVTAVDYSFEIPEGIAAGRTSFVMVNAGAEAHFMALSKIAEGHTLEEALAYEGDPEEAGLVESVEGGESGLAAPGGDDIEVMTVDLTPGEYAMLCFISGADGTPHAFMGMAVPFTVS